MTVTSSIGSGAVVEPNALLTDGTQLIGGEWGPAAGGETIDVINPDMRIAQEEIFGPVLSVLSYSSEDEAVQIANGVRYGLNACVWTSDVGRAVRLARRIEAGQVTLNGFGSRGVIGRRGAAISTAGSAGL